jgi:hypothetical protein
MTSGPNFKRETGYLQRVMYIFVSSLCVLRQNFDSKLTVLRILNQYDRDILNLGIFIISWQTDGKWSQSNQSGCLRDIEDNGSKTIGINHG